MKLLKPARFIALLSACWLPVGAVQAADIDWEGWSFDWSTNNESSGLVLTQVLYNGQKILDKASMPVMRVEYQNDVCGPYADIMSTSSLRQATQGAPNSACDNQSVCTRQFTRNGEQMLEVGSNWQIGEYQIYQTYYFSENGYFDARIYSRGLQCMIDHNHHPHWMFDFDIGDPGNDSILSDGVIQTNEFNDQKSATSIWTIRDSVSGDEVRVIPAVDDGTPDNFSQWDVAGRRHNAAETGRWRNGARGEIGNLFNNSQSIQGEDVVLWYVSHLAHASTEGSNIWHASGPRIEVVTSAPPTSPPPTPTPPSPPTADNMLSNGGFEQGQAGWFDCGASQNTSIETTTTSDGARAMKIRNSGCLYQEVTVNPGDNLTLSCDANRGGNQWTVMDLSFSDANYNVLATNTTQIASGAGFTSQQKFATAPATTRQAVVVLYSEDETYFDNCVLEPGNTVPPPAPNQSNNLLVNGDFENALSGWQPCSSASLTDVSGDAASGQASLAVTGGGCLYQEFNVNAGNDYELNCAAKRTGSAYTSVRLAMLDSSYNSLSSDELPVNSPDYQNYAATASANANASIGVAVVYSEDPANFDNCAVSQQ